MRPDNSVQEKKQSERILDSSKISGESRERILEARANGNYELALDYVLDILDVIDVEK